MELLSVMPHLNQVKQQPRTDLRHSALNSKTFTQIFVTTLFSGYIIYYLVWWVQAMMKLGMWLSCVCDLNLLVYNPLKPTPSILQWNTNKLRTREFTRLVKSFRTCISTWYISVKSYLIAFRLLSSKFPKIMTNFSWNQICISVFQVKYTWNVHIPSEIHAFRRVKQVIFHEIPVLKFCSLRFRLIIKQKPFFRKTNGLHIQYRVRKFSFAHADQWRIQDFP